jgi:hypothetical protein
MTETLPAAAYTWNDVLAYLATFMATDVVWKSIAVFIAISLGVLAVRSLFRMERA